MTHRETKTSHQQESTLDKIMGLNPQGKNPQEKYTTITSNSKKYTTITFDSKEYPYLLKHIEKPPNPLYALGNTALLNQPCVAVVGTRKPTKEGKTAAKNIAKFYGANGFIIVSGLALGVDSISMKAALKAGAPVIGVLPSSLDNIVPRKNKSLAEEILKNKGLLISEHPKSTKVQKYHFIERNRIISGISMLTVVVETSIKGGTMHTVNFAKEQKRPIVVADLPNEGNQKLKKESIPVFTNFNL